MSNIKPTPRTGAITAGAMTRALGDDVESPAAPATPADDDEGLGEGETCKPVEDDGIVGLTVSDSGSLELRIPKGAVDEEERDDDEDEVIVDDDENDEDAKEEDETADGVEEGITPVEDSADEIEEADDDD